VFSSVRSSVGKRIGPSRPSITLTIFCVS
jgi:hypothetical protein